MTKLNFCKQVSKMETIAQAEAKITTLQQEIAALKAQNNMAVKQPAVVKANVTAKAKEPVIAKVRVTGVALSNAGNGYNYQIATITGNHNVYIAGSQRFVIGDFITLTEHINPEGHKSARVCGFGVGNKFISRKWV